MKTLPLELTLLDTCLPDYFQGFAGPTLAIPVDARTTASQLQHALVNDEAWPTGLTEDEVRTLVNACIGETALRRGTRLFPDIAPSDPPEQFAVRPHPTIDNMWLVIDPDLDILSSWDTYGEAVLEAWDYVDESDMPATIYAYFGLRWTQELPEGWKLSHVYNQVWVASWVHGVNLGLFDTEFEATLAAWRHYLAQSEFTTYGKAQPTHECRWVAGINHHRDDTWWARIQVYGRTAKDAESLRDRVLDALTAVDEIHQILDGIEWDSDTVTKVAQVIECLGYTIRDPEDEQ